jgi:hypothetical protein
MAGQVGREAFEQMKLDRRYYGLDREEERFRAASAALLCPSEVREAGGAAIVQ